MPIPFDTARAAAAAVRDGELSPLELLDECLAAVDALDPQLNAIIWRDDTAARAAARRAGEALAHGDRGTLPPFHGVPMPIKDLTAVAGWPATYGSFGGPGTPAAQSALVVDALRRAGFVLAGRTNTPEFGALPVTENDRYGITRNPWDPTRTPGGSSGGAAAAVAAGMFPIAHGNDGGGSIRVPAACTGLVGFKASRGRVPSRVRPWEGTVVEGVLTRDVRDTAAVLDAVCGPDRGAWFNAPAPGRPFATEPDAEPGRLRIGLQTTASFALPVHPDCSAAARAAADALADAGHDVREVSVELLTEAALTGYVFLASAGLSHYPDIDWTRTEPHIRAAHARGQAIDSLTYTRTLSGLADYARSLTAVWGADFDVLLTPTMATLPPPAGELLANYRADPSGAPMALLQMTAFTTAANLSGLPAVSLPLAETAHGLPVGVMLTGGPWDDATLLQLAGQLERLLPWTGRRAPARTA